LTSYLTGNNGRYLLAWPADAQGNFAYGDASSLVPISASRQADFPGQATTLAKLTAVLPATGAASSTSIAYFAPSGIPSSIQEQAATLTFTQTSNLTWNLDVTDQNNAPLAGPFTVTFDSNGNLSSAPQLDIGGLFSLDISNVAERGSTFVRTLYSQD